MDIFLFPISFIRYFYYNIYKFVDIRARGEDTYIHCSPKFLPWPPILFHKLKTTLIERKKEKGTFFSWP